MTGAVHSGNEKAGPGEELIFFRASDAENFEAVVRAVLADATLVEIIGREQSTLDHYGRMLIRRLRKEPAIELEVFLPTGVDNLLERFNRALASMSMAQAASAQPADRPAQVLLLKETGRDSTHDGRILAKLVRSFPAASLKLISLRFEPEAAAQPDGVQATGARSLRWKVEPPSREEARQMLLAAPDAERAASMQALFGKMDGVAAAGEASHDTKRPRRLSIAVSEPEEAILPRALPAGGKAAEVGSTQRARPFSLGVAVYALGILLMISATVTALLYPDQTRALVQMTGLMPAPIVVPERTSDKALPNNDGPVRGMVIRGTNAVEKINPLDGQTQTVNGDAQKETTALPAGVQQAAQAGAATAAAVGTASSANRAPATAAPAENALPVKSPAQSSPVSAAPAPAQPVIAVAPASSGSSTSPADKSKVVIIPGAERAPGSDKAEPKAEVKPAAPPPAPEKAVARPTESKQAAAGVVKPGAGASELAKVLETPADFFFVQHVSLDTREAALKWRAEHAAFANARVLPTYIENTNKKMFIVINGPFRSREAADTFMRKRGNGSEYWVRGAASLKKVLDTTEAARPAAKGGQP